MLRFGRKTVGVMTLIAAGALQLAAVGVADATDPRVKR